MIAATARTEPTTREAASLVAVTGIAAGPDLTEIGRLAVHVAALERAVLPVAAVRLRDGAARVKELRRLGRELVTALHWLDRHLTGDARAVRWPTHQLAAAVRSAAASHARSERALVSALAGVLEDSENSELVRAYHRASLTAPTRPHPRLTCRTPRGRLVFRIIARIDAMRDVVDNRAVRSRVKARAASALRDLEAITCADEPAHVSASPTASAPQVPAAVLA
jgi:hypothetical protein